MLIKEGHDPFHAVYVFMQNMTAHFAETISGLPEMEPWAKAVAKAEDEYMPSGPPMSPLSRSFFWMWALFDLRIGKSQDTVGECQIAANDVIWMNEHQLDAAKKMSGSRMGIYENVGTEGPFVLLRELITEGQLLRPCPTGYRGRVGNYGTSGCSRPWSLRFTRSWVAMTTPYVLLDASKREWIDFLRRTMLQCKGADELKRLSQSAQVRLGPELLERVRLQGIRQLPNGCRFPDRHPGHESHATARIRSEWRNPTKDTKVTRNGNET